MSIYPKDNHSNVHISDILSTKLNLGFSRSVETQEINPGVLSDVGITSEDLEQIIQKLPEATDEAMVMLQDNG